MITVVALLGMSGCVEDTMLGETAAPVELARGLTRPLALQAASTYLVDVDDPTIANVHLVGDHLEITALAEGTTLIHLTYRETAIHVPTTVLPAAITNLVVTPTDVSTAIGGTVPLVVMATNTARELVEATDLARWTVDDPAVARVGDDGLHGMAAGTTRVRATVDGMTSSASVAVAP